MGEQAEYLIDEGFQALAVHQTEGCDGPCQLCEDEEQARRPVVWLEWCPSCKRKHRVSMQPCPSCGVYYVPQPVSENVANSCRRLVGSMECDGCEAYREHLR